jgi:phytoene dehydrogenase-like protein
MDEAKVVIIGGGLAGLSAGCYARANGLTVTIVEHNLALGGVCTAWHRGPYLVDGCIHWLTGGPFSRLYEELGILPRVKIRPLQEFCTYRHARDGWAITSQPTSGSQRLPCERLRRKTPKNSRALSKGRAPSLT